MKRCPKEGFLKTKIIDIKTKIMSKDEDESSHYLAINLPVAEESSRRSCATGLLTASWSLIDDIITRMKIRFHYKH